MKNIHVIPTDKPSGLYSYKSNLFLTTESHLNVPSMKYQNLYITSDEEIKGNDFFLSLFSNTAQKEDVTYGLDKRYYKKIILTTDSSLAPDVQKIDDEFLEWLVKNSSCEEIETSKIKTRFRDEWRFEYKITIPKEETKKETLEEAAERFYGDEEIVNDYDISGYLQSSFLSGAKWQQETDRKYFHKYIKSEKDFQTEKMSKLGINTTGQCFEQMVTSLIIQQERSYSEEEVIQLVSDWTDYRMSEDIKSKVTFKKYLNNLKTNKMKQTAVEWFFEQIMYADVDIKVWREILEQAKEMEKEQGYSEEDVKNAFLDGWQLRDGDLPFPKAKKKWFNEFKKI